MWRDTFPDAAFVAPDAPNPFDMGPGRQWFSVAGVREENCPGRVAGAIGGLVELVEAERLRAGVANADVALVEFSQGSIMALHLAMAHPACCGAVLDRFGRCSPRVLGQTRK
jgi:phospholipase/carboxylesterase